MRFSKRVFKNFTITFIISYYSSMIDFLIFFLPVCPQDASSHSNLGAMLHLNGKHREALSSYQNALRISPNDQTTLDNLNKLRNVLRRRSRAWYSVHITRMMIVWRERNAALSKCIFSIFPVIFFFKFNLIFSSAEIITPFYTLTILHMTRITRNTV